MGRKRTRDKHLPKSVYHRHGAYYFVDHKGKWRRLGSSLGEAYRALAELVEAPTVRNVADLCDRYTREVLPSYTEKEQKNRAAHLIRIRAVFGAMEPGDVQGGNVRAFRDKIGQREGRNWGRPQLALKALATLSHVFSWAAEWGVVDRNPCIGVERPPQPTRTRLPSDDEFAAVRARCPEMHRIAMDIALLTGLRREDLITLDRDSDTDSGLLVHTGKTGKGLLFGWTPELRAAVDRAWAQPPRVRRYLICRRDGKRYSPDGFSRIWKRAHDKALEAGALASPFRFNDIRAKSASDDASTDRASHRLGHTTRQTTERFYIRAPKKVEPLR